MSTEMDWRWVLRTDITAAARPMQRQPRHMIDPSSDSISPARPRRVHALGDQLGEFRQQNPDHPGQQAYNPKAA